MSSAVQLRDVCADTPVRAYLTSVDVCALRRVSRWASCLLGDANSAISDADGRTLTPQEVSILLRTHSRAQTSLAIHSHGLRDGHLLSELRDLVQLRVLDLSGCALVSSTEAVVSLLDSLPCLEIFDIGGCGRLPVSLDQSLLAQSNLTAVHTQNCTYTLQDPILHQIAQKSQLKGLGVFDCHSVNDEAVLQVIKSCTLEYLNIGRSVGMPMYNLVWGARPTKVVQALCASPSLTTLRRLCIKGRDIYAEHNRSQNMLSPSDFELLGRLVALEELDVSGTKIYGLELAHVVQNVSLTSLSISYCKIHRLGEEIISHLSRLRVFHAHASNGVTDGCIRLLRKHCTQLQDLNISLTNITAASLAYLRSMTSLRHLNIRCCSRVLSSTLDGASRAFVHNGQKTRVYGHEKFAQEGRDVVDMAPWRKTFNFHWKEFRARGFGASRGLSGYPGDAVWSLLRDDRPCHTVKFVPRDTNERRPDPGAVLVMVDELGFVVDFSTSASRTIQAQLSSGRWR